MEKAEYGFAHYGNARYNVYIPDWDNEILPKLKEIDASAIWTEMLDKMKER